jgi:alpha-ribazole phosphatase
MELILVRHATTQGNLEHRFIGITDIPILPQGEDLARSVSTGLPAVDHVYRSPLRRCQQTAALLWPQHKDQTVVPGLRETDFGPFEGKNHEELKNDPLYLQWLNDADLSKLPVGESVADCVHRLTAAIQEVIADAKSHGYSRVGVCTHGGSLMALMDALSIPRRPHYYDWECPNCSGYAVKVEEEPLRLHLLSLVGNWK